MATTQFNVRIDEADKAAGDDAFASIDYSPSQIVQAVWGYAARNRRNKKALRELTTLVDQQASAAASEKERKLSMLEEGQQLYLNMLEEMGIEGIPAPLEMTDEELLYQAYLEKMAERGMPV